MHVFEFNEMNIQDDKQADVRVHLKKVCEESYHLGMYFPPSFDVDKVEMLVVDQFELIHTIELSEIAFSLLFAEADDIINNAYEWISSICQ